MRLPAHVGSPAEAPAARSPDPGTDASRPDRCFSPAPTTACAHSRRANSAVARRPGPRPVASPAPGSPSGPPGSPSGPPDRTRRPRRQPAPAPTTGAALTATPGPRFLRPRAHAGLAEPRSIHAPRRLQGTRRGRRGRTARKRPSASRPPPPRPSPSRGDNSDVAPRRRLSSVC
ncbi:Hypothetical predicted protein [Marmota monax]|uniref:Uncharacterized protein n=1 Tax=Marmota monax TaxID=9995 RepID=A0A5E4C3W2_MARMO|nr:Hypothetical predicted protein [Marmota monax]